jgi:hypothetical protein
MKQIHNRQKLVVSADSSVRKHLLSAQKTRKEMAQAQSRMRKKHLNLRKFSNPPHRSGSTD